MIIEIKDIDKVIRCLRQFDASAPIRISERYKDLNLYAQKLYNNANNYYFVRDKKTLGFISFYANYGDTAYLALIAVEPAHKGLGIGSQMLEFALDVSRGQGMKRMKLEVSRENTEAIAFYLKKLFITEAGDGGHTYYMIREL